MEQNDGLEAKISKEETRTILTMDLEIPPLLIRVSLQDQTSHREQPSERRKIT